ncbi:hypothetical protein OBBRIDRAFT_836580 [Obba rivulosa]|uniref:Uncharacterized protein n=1 Tax=Obba rivulosa TaxID=1052685 RepID=A0A8E2APF2_9APHY|nr:hypothetical protein OBBRIDRAFT_836580 [Obba rivulosa]
MPPVTVLRSSPRRHAPTLAAAQGHGIAPCALVARPGAHFPSYAAQETLLPPAARPSAPRAGPRAGPAPLHQVRGFLPRTPLCRGAQILAGREAPIGTIAQVIPSQSDPLSCCSFVSSTIDMRHALEPINKVAITRLSVGIR